MTFELPKIYMPYAARLNPNVDDAHRHTREWARRVGILDSGVWSEADLESTDCAQYASLCHPDAPAATHNLITDWFVLTFFWDDFFLETFKLSGDLPGGKRYVNRMSEFMPLLPCPLPEPRDAFECGLADLWPRTMFSMSPELLGRFRGHLKEYFNGTLWELRNRCHDWVPDPIEFAEMRRWVGGTTFTRDLVQWGVGAEISSQVHETYTINALFRAWADWVGICNDLFSVTRESESENEMHNAVLISQHFLRSDRQDAANLVNEFLTRRVFQFDHVVDTELQELFDDWDMNAAARGDIVRHVQGLRDWMAGTLEFMFGSPRYVDGRCDGPSSSRGPLAGPSGIGTSAARLHDRSW
jgi:germacradienol/geosmin synthase